MCPEDKRKDKDDADSAGNDVRHVAHASIMACRCVRPHVRSRRKDEKKRMGIHQDEVCRILG
jgi:hypothetical protein